MSKYALDPQYRTISHLFLPLYRNLSSPIQTMMRLWPCRSDKETDVTRILIPGSDGNRIPTLVIRPKGLEGNLPCLNYIHGGGFVFCAAPYHYTLAKKYAVSLGCTVVFPDYRLAPKYPYPAAAEDCFAVYQWMIENSAALRIDADRVILGGDSAGGDLTAAVTLMARDRGVKLPIYQMLIYPVADRHMQTESSLRYRDTPVWNTAASEKMWAFYLPSLPKDHIEYASPLEAPSLNGLPPAYLEVAEFDSLRDEGLAYGKRLEEAGIRVEYYETHGTPHGFEFVLNVPITQKAIAHRIEVLRKVLESE